MESEKKWEMSLQYSQYFRYGDIFHGQVDDMYLVDESYKTSFK